MKPKRKANHGGGRQRDEGGFMGTEGDWLYLVDRGSGFIGSHLVEALLARGEFGDCPR